MTKPCAAVAEVQVLDGYQVELTFSDGARGVVDLERRILNRGGIFEALESADFFRQVTVDGELGTIVWPNGADFCPNLLYDWAKGQPVPRPDSEAVES